VVGDDVTVVLPGSERSRVAGLWEAVDAGATADAALDALLAGGLSGLHHFALVARRGGATRLILRGTPSATVTTSAGERALAAEPGTTWLEQVLTDVTALRVELDGDAAGAAEHDLTPGIARVAVVEVGTPSAAAPAPAPDATPEAAPEPVAPELDAVAEPVPVPEPAPAAPMSFGQPDADPTPTGETPAVADGWSDRDGQTVIGEPAPEFDRPPIPGQEVAPDVVPEPVASLVFSTGDVVAVDRAVLVGRAPEARRFASHDQPHVVTVPSPHQEISSTHLEIRPGAGADHGSAIATDLGSTNGTVVAQPGLEPEELQPGIAVSLIPGAVIDLGDGVTIQVTNP
jgi:hypothetical protein